MKWKQEASMRFRGISSAMNVLHQEAKINRVPSHETCIQWDLKIGFHKLNRPKHATSDWCWIIDHVIAQGATKCLSIMGVRYDVLHQRNDWTLRLQDLEPFGLIPMHRSTGEEVSKTLYAISQKTGIIPRFVLSDRGSDLLLGLKGFQKMAGSNVIVLYDICHKIAREYEKLFTDNPEWEEFKSKANYCKKQLHCTNGVSFAPPAQRKKARYLNVDIIIGWAMKILQYKGPWDQKEQLLAPLLEYFDKIHLSDEQIEKIVASLKQSYAHEQEFFKHSQEVLRKELDQIQNRLSKLIDMHVDGTIDSETYSLKLEEYKKRQRDILSEMKAHVNADETCLITAKTVLDLAKRAKEIFISSNLAEKQQLLNFVFSNLKLDGKKLLVTLREPFSTLLAVSHQPANLRV